MYYAHRLEGINFYRVPEKIFPLDPQRDGTGIYIAADQAAEYLELEDGEVFGMSWPGESDIQGFRVFKAKVTAAKAEDYKL